MLFHIIILSHFKLKDCGGPWGWPLRILLAVSPVYLARYEVCPCSMWEKGHNWNIVCQICNVKFTKSPKKFNISVLYVPCTVWWLICRTVFVVTVMLSNALFDSVTIYDNNYEVFLMMARVVCRNMLEIRSYVRNTFNACKASFKN
jgi:hypothetical protein